MKVGVKFYSKEILTKIDYEFADFIEVLPMLGVDYSSYKSIKKEMTVHVPHESFGLKLCDKNSLEENRKIISFSLQAADDLKAKRIVIHPGHLRNGLKKDEAIKNVVSIMSEFNDKRFIIENLPLDPINEPDFISATPADCKLLMDELKLGLCLDFSHAAVTAMNLGLEYKQFINSFLPLKPTYFHINGIILEKKRDGHVGLLQGNIDIVYLRSIVQKVKNSMVLLETPLDPAERKEEVEFLKRR